MLSQSRESHVYEFHSISFSFISSGSDWRMIMMVTPVESVGRKFAPFITSHLGVRGWRCRERSFKFHWWWKRRRGRRCIHWDIFVVMIVMKFAAGKFSVWKWRRRTNSILRRCHSWSWGKRRGIHESEWKKDYGRKRNEVNVKKNERRTWRWEQDASETCTEGKSWREDCFWSLRKKGRQVSLRLPLVAQDSSFSRECTTLYTKKSRLNYSLACLRREAKKKE